MRFEIVFSPISLLLIGLAATCYATDDQLTNQYPIQATQLSRYPDVITHMRHFMPKQMRPEERCKRIAVVLNYVNQNAKKSMNDFKVADWAMTKFDFIREHFSRISIETLRELYTNAILQYHANHQVDGGLLETIECLRSKFSRGNGNVRVLMRQPWLTKTVEQYGIISKSPASKLITSQDEFGYDDDQDNFELKWSELEPGIQQSITNWMSGDVSRAMSLFSDDADKLQAPAEQHHATQPAHHHQKQQQQQQPEVPQAPKVEVPPAPKSQQQKQQQNEVSDGDNEDQFDYDSIDWSEIYEDAGLNQVYEDIREKYLEKIDQKLGARCKAYSDAMGIQTPELASADATFVPDSEARDSFLWIVRHALKLFDTDPSAWFDLIDCVDQWQDLDKAAKAFINHPSTSYLFSKMLTESELEEPTDHTQSTDETVELK